MTTWLPAFLVLNDLCFKLLCDKHNCLCYYKNDISENDFCGNESIFIFFYRYTSYNGNESVSYTHLTLPTIYSV